MAGAAVRLSLPALIGMLGALPPRCAGVSRLRSRRQQQRPASVSAFDYGYANHGEDWGVGMCAGYQAQSPIDLPAEPTATGQPFFYNYDESPRSYDIAHTGSTLALEWASHGLGGIYYDDVWYGLLNINAHTVSEHMWSGAHAQAELHLVHKRYDDGNLLVVAIGFNASAGGPAPAPAAAPAGASATFNVVGSGPAPSPAHVSLDLMSPEDAPGFKPVLQAFLATHLPEPGHLVEVNSTQAKTMALNELYGEANFLEYYGSTTAPPCAEGVTWLVREEALEMSQAQAFILQSVIFSMTGGYGNNRAVTPLNGRPVTQRQAVREQTSPTVAHGFLRKPGESLRATMARRSAEEAMNIARATANKVQVLDSAELEASRAEAAVWASASAPAPAPAPASGR